MKRAFYIFCFVLLGVLLQFIVHALLEIAVIALLLKDFGRYGLGMSSSQWYMIHHVLSVILFALGAWWGYANGLKFWNIIYVEKRFGWPPSWKRKFVKEGRSPS